MRPTSARVLLRSKVARQLLWSFLLSAGIPVAVLAVLTFSDVSTGLREQSRERLHQAAKSSGLLLLDRLVATRDFLQATARASDPDTWKASTGMPWPPGSRALIVAATLVRSDGTRLPLVGPLITPLAAQGRLEVRDGVEGPVIVFGVPLEASSGASPEASPQASFAGPSLVAALDPGRFFDATIPQALPPHAEYCVTASSGRVLGCSRDGLAPLLPHTSGAHAGAFETNSADARYFGSYWTLFLDAQLQAESWTVFVLEPSATALGALARFRLLFPLLALACFGLVFLASVSRIRRQMEPLDRLEEATRELGAGRFDIAVQVDREDEFRTLADSFNGMARRLEGQFELLARLIDLDREILAASDERSIARALLDGLPAVHPCAAVCVLLAAPDRPLSFSGWMERVVDDERLPVSFELSEDEAAALRVGPGVRDCDGHEAPFGSWEPLARMGTERVRVLPLHSAEGLCGFLLLVRAPGDPTAWPDPAVVRQVADQAAVAFVTARTAERNRFLAQRDALTGLANRSLFRDRLEQALVAARRSGTLVGVCLLDLDRFKGVNDTWGHAAGDRLLQRVAERMHGDRREGSLARMGGDEFTLLLPDLASADACSSIAQSLLRGLGPPFDTDGREVFVSASVGIALFPLDGDSADDLLKHADTAMYEAKRSGGNRLAFYTQSLSARASQRLALEAALRHALENDEIVPYYQPLVDAHSREWVGFEVLSRWTHAELGAISPEDFIPLAEEIGLIGILGERILRLACAQSRAWQIAHRRALYVSVNLSSRQLRDPGLPGRVAQILAETGLDPQLLVLELTESELMEESDHGRAQLASLRALGLRISIDDFGTGYSSLGYLQSFPLDCLKIDRRFLAELGRGGVGDAIVRAIIDIGHVLDLDVVAEGVEREEQRAALHALGCDVLQGWLFDRALPAEDVEKRLAGEAAPRDV